MNCTALSVRRNIVVVSCLIETAAHHLQEKNNIVLVKMLLVQIAVLGGFWLFERSD